MPRFSKCLIVAVLTLSLGLHWALLQSIAWSAMIVEFSKSASLGTALVKTFNGRNPCQLCKLVAAGKSAGQKQAVQQPVLKLEFPIAAAPVVLYPPSVGQLLSVPDVLLGTRAQSPPVPPPRSLLG